MYVCSWISILNVWGYIVGIGIPRVVTILCQRHEVDEQSVWIALVSNVMFLYLSHMISMKSHVTSI